MPARWSGLPVLLSRVFTRCERLLPCFRSSFTLRTRSSKLGVVLWYSEPHCVRPAASGDRLSEWYPTYYRQRAHSLLHGLLRAQFYAIRLRSSCKPVSLTTRGVASLQPHSASCFGAFGESNLVDPASSHMLVSKIKPCMSKYKFFTAKL